MAKELLSNQRSLTHATLKAHICRVPKLPLVFDPLCISVDNFPAFKTPPRVQSVVALHAVWMTITCHIKETSQIPVTLVTTKVLPVPIAVLCLGVLTAKYQLERKKFGRIEILSLQSRIFGVQYFLSSRCKLDHTKMCSSSQFRSSKYATSLHQGYYLSLHQSFLPSVSTSLLKKPSEQWRALSFSLLIWILSRGVFVRECIIPYFQSLYFRLSWDTFLKYHYNRAQGWI